MIAWVAALARRLPFSGVASVTDSELDRILENITEMRSYLAEVELKVMERRTAPQAAPAVHPTMSVDDDIDAADSVTRLHKAMEREWHVDRRTVYQRVERVVKAFQLDKQAPEWRADLAFQKRLFAKDADGARAIDRALAKLEVRP